MRKSNAIVCEWCGAVVHKDESYQVKYRSNGWEYPWFKRIICEKCYHNMLRPSWCFDREGKSS